MPHVLETTLTTGEYEAVYNALSMTIAAMGACSIFFFLNSMWVQDTYKSAVAISGLVTLIACYHYFRIFNSWDDAYHIECDYGQNGGNASGDCTVTATGAPFNDAYRYMDWFLTVPLLLVEVVLIMNLKEKATMVSVKLGAAAALMIVLGYPGEISDSNGTRWLFWALAMIPFCYIVYTLFVGLADSVKRQPESVRDLISNVRYVTIISWLTYPIVFVLPMLGLKPSANEIGIQVGYSFSDVISKCIVGLMVTYIAKVRSSGSDAESTPLIN